MDPFNIRCIYILASVSIICTGLVNADEENSEAIYAEIGKPVEFQPKGSENKPCVWLLNSLHISIDPSRRIHASSKQCKIIFKEVHLKDFNSSLIVVPLHEPEKTTRHHLILKGLSLDVKLRFGDEKLFLGSPNGAIFTDELYLKLTCEASSLVHPHYSIGWIVNNKNMEATQPKTFTNRKKTVYHVEDELKIHLDTAKTVQCTVRDSISGDSAAVTLNVMKKDSVLQGMQLMENNEEGFSFCGLLFNTLLLLGVIGIVRRIKLGRKAVKNTAVYLAVNVPKWFNKASEFLSAFYQGPFMTNLKEQISKRVEQYQPLLAEKKAQLISAVDLLRNKLRMQTSKSKTAKKDCKNTEPTMKEEKACLRPPCRH